MKKIIGLTLSVAIIVAVVGVFLAGAALAQDPTATPAPATPTAPSSSPRVGPYEALSKLLGMTPQEIYDARKAGKTLSDLGKDKGVTDQQLTDALVGNHKAYLDQAVKDGKLTQKQADWLLQAAQTMAQLQLTNPFAMGRMGAMMGGFGMMGGRGPMMGGRGPMMRGRGPMMGGGWGEKGKGWGNGWNNDDRSGRDSRRGGGMMPWGNHMSGRNGWGGWFDKGGNNNSNQPGPTPVPSTTPSNSSTA
jgi:hypothetical protein